MFTFRTSMFETNSSSMHSMVIAKTSGYYSPEEALDAMYLTNNNKVFDIFREEDLEFPRYPFNVLTTLGEKFCYAVAEYCGDLPPEEAHAKFQELSQILKDFLPNLQRVEPPKADKGFYYDLETGEEVSWDRILDADDTDDERLPYKDASDTLRFAREEIREVPYYGFVDHQSLGRLPAFLEKEHLTLKDFLTRREYWIVIDGDEYGTWDKLKKNGVINVQNILSEYPPEH